MSNVPDEVRIPESACLHCGKVMNSATCVTDNSRPNPGDATICLHCGHLMFFSDTLVLRNPTDTEIKEIAADPILLMAQRLRARYWQERNSK